MEVRRAITLTRGVRVSRKKHKQVFGYKKYIWWNITEYYFKSVYFPICNDFYSFKTWMN